MIDFFIIRLALRSYYSIIAINFKRFFLIYLMKF